MGLGVPQHFNADFLKNSFDGGIIAGRWCPLTNAIKRSRTSAICDAALQVFEPCLPTYQHDEGTQAAHEDNEIADAARLVPLSLGDDGLQHQAVLIRPDYDQLFFSMADHFGHRRAPALDHG